MDVAKRVLEANEAVLYGFFGMVAACGYFPPLNYVNEFFMLGNDPCDQDGRMGCWQPFALSPVEYDEIKARWATNHPATVESDLGACCWDDWVQEILSPKDVL